MQNSTCPSHRQHTHGEINIGFINLYLPEYPDYSYGCNSMSRELFNDKWNNKSICFYYGSKNKTWNFNKYVTYSTNLQYFSWRK